MQGLNNGQVIESRKKNGSNKLEISKKNSFLKEYLSSLGDPIIRILLIALGIKTLFLMHSFDWFETVGIAIAIFLASFISTVSEYGSEKAFLKLQEEASKIKTKVKRNNKIEEIEVEDVVVDDIIILETGDKIPADGLVIHGEISVDESQITGESKEIYKTKGSTVYKGTTVLSKESIVKITKVGIDTFYGTISKELQEKQPDSPLKIKLNKLAQIISKIGYIGAILVFISYMFQVIFIANNFQIHLIIEMFTSRIIFKHLLYAITLSVTIIVVAVPEGLPMMITLVLSSNMKRLLKNNVLVRKLNGIETAGSLNILFSDKTGTITTGKLSVTSFVTSTLNPVENVELLNQNLKQYVYPSLIANNSSKYNEDKIIGGNITDKAILKFTNKNITYNIKEKVPFNSTNKYSQVTLMLNNTLKTLTKGAPEILLKNCDSYLDENGNKKYLKNTIEINKYINNCASMGNRIICFTMSETNQIKNLTLIGFTTIKDTVRPEAKEGIDLVKSAGIQTVMVTGDNKNTAISIAKEVGLLKNNDKVITSEEMKLLSDNKLKELLPNLKVVARAIPQDKSRLVRISQELNLVVGMTGDGVNDAPALKKADIGFAFGSGTEVAKEASEIVILDDNFLSISKSILYGRTIFKSIRKFIIFQLTVNMCAVSLSIIGPFIGIDTPVTVIQMLWVNMVMDTLAAVAFSFEPALKEYMLELPKKRDEQIINKYMLNQIFATGLYTTLLCILFIKLPIFHELYRNDVNEKYILTAFFGLFIFTGIFNCFNTRTHRLNLLANLKQNQVFVIIILFIIIVQIFLIYFGGNIFRSYGLSLFEFQIMLLLSLTVIPFDFLRKFILRKKGIIGGV